MPPGIGCRSAPAPGGRGHGSGLLYSVGNDGYSWSTSVSTDNTGGHYLYFNHSIIYPKHANSRAFGLPLHCLQEEGCRWARQPGLTAEKKRVAASGERNEHRRVASPRPGWRRRARPSGPQLTGWTTTGLLSQTLPSRGEYNSFLSPAPAAGALTFCYAAESKQRSQPRG